MHEIIFYSDSKGNRPVFDYMQSLEQKGDKDSRLRLDKVTKYIEKLSEGGTQIGMPFVKHLDGDIWELRPMRDRILFFAWTNGSYVLLHSFMKKTQKTPRREIERAKRELQDWIQRGGK